jgi:general secretion pathway protein D
MDHRPGAVRLPEANEKVMHKRLLTALTVIFLVSPLRAQEHTLNLQDAEVQVLVATVAEITGRNFIVDPRVTGKVTVISSQAMNEDQVYRVFLSILQVHGFAAVPGENVTKIVPDIAARQSAGEGAGGEAIITQVVPVQSVAASELLPVLRPLMPQQAHLVALDKANALLVSDRRDNVARIRQLVERIDHGSEDPVETIVLRHANAVELARTLNMLFPAAGGETAIADERTNTLLLKGDPAQRLRLRALVGHLDSPAESGGATQVVYLRYASAADLVPILETTLRSLQGGADDGSGPSIQAHEETNALVITAPPAVFRSLQAVIRQLDIRRAQVLVEAVIAEVSAEVVRELGVQWQMLSSLDAITDASGNVIDVDGGTFGGTNFGGRGTGVNIFDLATNPAGAASGLNIGYLSGSTTVLGMEFLQIGAVIRALAADSDTNILSTPSLVTLDNQEAQIFVGEEIPFITGQFTNTGAAQGSVNPFQTIQRETVGLTLNVTPHINEGDSVVLEIREEVSSLSRTQVAVDLTTQKRELLTTVMVPDNTILVLGGLTTDDVSESEEAVPGVSRIPVIGNLFKYRKTSNIKRNLMLFIRPRILRSDADQLNISTEKYNYLRSEQIRARSETTGMTPPEEMPLLPELFDYLQTPVPEPPDGN